MSYRDLRNFTEMLRALGYTKLVSMESFRRPNFPLIAHLLLWLAKRFEPEVDIPLEIENEDERVLLIRNVAQFMAIKANIKLNTKRLYQADGYAVKELLKIASLLYDALIISTERQSNEDDSELSIRDFDISDKIHDLKQSRQLASEITMSGASLFDLLGKEIDLRGLRQVSIGRQYEVSDVEEAIKRAIGTLKSEISETKQLIDNVAATETSLDTKIERRKVEIDRYEKRLQTLKKVRPAFLEEFNQLELELNRLFEQYSVRLRCLTQLEKLAVEAERIQLERQLASSQKIVTAAIPLDMPEDDELAVNEPVPTMHSNTMDRGGGGGVGALPSRQERPRARTGARSRPDDVTKVLGVNPGLSNSGSSLDITDSDSEDLFLDKDEPELDHSDDDSLGLELSGLEINKRAPSGRITSTKLLQDNSDDDF